MSEEGKSLPDKNLESNIENSIFKLVYMLVRDTNISSVLYALLMLIQVIQVFYFKFHDIVIVAWENNTTSKYMQEVFGYFNFAHYAGDIKFELFQIVLYFTIGMVGFWVFLILVSVLLLINQKLPGQIFLSVLKLMTLLNETILFIPVMNILVLPLDCNDGYFTNFPSQQCWQGLYVIDQIMGLILFILYVIVSISAQVFYFQGVYDQDNIFSRRNNRDQVLTSVHHLLLVLFSILPHDNNSRIFYEIYQLVGALICYLYAKDNDTYNNRFIQKVILTALTLDLWTSLMLCISELVEGRIMVGSIYTWLFCLPFLFVIQFLQSQYREQCLMIYVNKFDNPIQLVNHVNEVLNLVEMDKKRLPQGQLLNGYIEFHNQTCPNPLCPLKRVKFSLNMFKAKNEIISKTDKRHSLVFDTMSRLYGMGISKFPSDVFIRIEYALYTLRVLKSKPQALDEISKIEKLYQSYDQRYILYYIKSVIEAEISELQGEGQDFTEQRDFEEKFTLFKNAMERSVALLMEFWSQFADEKPDLIKLYEIGSKLFPIRLYVEETWKRLQRIQNQQLPAALRLYSKYLIEIFNDRIAGYDLLEQARKIENQFQQRKAFKLGMSSNLNIDGQEDGCAFLSLEEERFGQIYAVNMSAASFFGYDKGELLNKKVNNIMPNLYARYHDDFLKRFIDTNEATLLNKERQLLSKNKNGYVYPVNVLLRPVYHVLKEGVEFVATFKKEKRIKDVAYLVCNKDLLVEDISAGSINILGIDIKLLSMQQIFLHDLFIDAKESLYDFRQKQGKIIDYTFPKILDDHVQFHASEQTIKLQVQVQEINFLIMKINEQDTGLAGFQVRVERSYDNIIQQTFPVKKQSNFQFRPQIAQIGMEYVGEQSDATNSELITHIQETVLINPEYEPFKIVESKQITQKDPSMDYSFGIRIMRLFDGQILDIEKFLSDADVESFEEQSVKQQDQMQESEEQIGDGGYFKSSKELQETLNQQSESRTIRWLYYSSMILLLILMLFAILNNVFERQEINDSNFQWDLMIQESDLILYVNQINSVTRELVFLQYFKHYNQTYLLNQYNNSIKQFDFISKNIFQYLPGDEIVEMHSQNEINKRTLEQASQQIVATALQIYNQQQIQQISYSDSTVIFIFKNILNDFSVLMLEQYMNTVRNSQNQTQQLYSQLLIILIMSACITLIASLILACILTSTLDKRQEILSIFLDIPEKTAKIFYTKCENFLQQISSNDEDEVTSDLEFIEEKNNDEQVSLFGRKKKRFKNNENKHLGFFLRMLMIGVVIEAYYIMIFFLNSNNIQKIENILNEFNYTTISSSYYALVINGLKSYIYDADMKILNLESKTSVGLLINNTYLIDTTYQRLHAINIDYNDQTYIDYYNQIMFDDLCNMFTDSQCKTFGNGILQHGLMTSISRHFQNIRELYNGYVSITNNNQFPISNYTVLNLTTNKTQNYYWNLLNIQQSYDLNEMQYQYIYGGFNNLKKRYIDIINLDQQNFTVQQLILLIFYLISLVLAQLLCWNPFLRDLNREVICFLLIFFSKIWSTKCLLTFIPIDEIAKIRTINNYIKRVILEQNI